MGLRLCISDVAGLKPHTLSGSGVNKHYLSLVAQLVKNPAMQETWVQTLGWEDPLEKRTSGLENSMDSIVHGVAKSRT